MSDLIELLVTANRILANEGIIRAFGHVSARSPDGDAMYISRSLPPKLVTAADVIEVPLDEDDDRTYNEAVVHQAIYRARPDVGAVVHHHARPVMPFVTTGTPLRPVIPGAAMFSPAVPTFDDYDPEAGRMVVTEAEGDRMAAALGDARAQLLAGHGANVVGETLEAAVTLTYRFVANADHCYRALQLGEPDYYTDPPEAVRATEELLTSPGVVDRLWTYLVDELPD